MIKWRIIIMKKHNQHQNIILLQLVDNKVKLFIINLGVLMVKEVLVK